MTLLVVDLLETVDVDERNEQDGARAMCALELPRHLLQAKLSTPGAGQLIGRCKGDDFIRFSSDPSRLGALGCCLVPFRSRVLSVVSRSHPVGCSPFAVTRGTYEDLLARRFGVALLVVQTRKRIAARRTPITKLRCVITRGRAFYSFTRCLIPPRRDSLTISTRTLPRPSAVLMSG